MQVIGLDSYPGVAINGYGSVGASFARIADLGTGSAASVVRVAPDGVLGLHPAPKPQLMIVIHGDGSVRGDDQASISSTQAWPSGGMPASSTRPGRTLLDWSC